MLGNVTDLLTTLTGVPNRDRCTTIVDPTPSFVASCRYAVPPELISGQTGLASLQRIGGTQAITRLTWTPQE